MPLAEKKLNTVARLAMGTAMMSVLAGCDGRFGRAFDSVVAPITGSNQTVATVPATAPAYGYEYVTPGVPTYTEQTQAANLQTFESVYGPPIASTSTGTYVAEQPFSVPSFNDGSVDVTPIAAPQVATYTQRVQQAQPAYSAAPAPMPIDTGAIAFIEPSPSTYSVATIPSPVVPTSTLPIIDTLAPASQPIFGVEAVAVDEMVKTEPATFDTDLSAEAYEISTAFDSGFTVVPTEQAYQPVPVAAPAPATSIAPAVIPVATPSTPQPSYDASFSAGAVEIISNEEAIATFGGEEIPAPLPSVGSSVFDNPDALPATGGQFQVLPQSNLDTPAPAVEEAGIIETMWNSLTTQTASATTTMAPIDADADRRAVVQTSPAPMRKAVAPTPAPMPVKVAAIDYSPQTAPTPRQRPVRAEASYATLTAPLPQPRPAYKKPIAMATTAGNYVSIGALPNIQTATLAAPKMPVDTMLPAAAMHGNAMVAPDTAPSIDVAMVTPPKPAKPAPTKATPAALSKTSELSGTSWRLIEVNSAPIDANAELHFDGRSGFAGGQGPCNSYGGEFRNTGKGNFAMSNIFTTDVACPSSAVEKQYIGALEKAMTYKISRDFSDLMLLDDNGATVATFRAF